MGSINCVQKTRTSVVHHNEYLSEDILDEGFVQLFAPIRLAQQVIGSCRVDVRDRFVTAPTVRQKCYTVVCSIVSIYFAISFLQSFLLSYDKYYDGKDKYLVLFGLSAQNVTLFMAVFHARFCNNERNVQFYIKMQKIDNVMKLNNNNSIRRDQYKQNIVYVLLLVMFVGAQLIGSYALTYREFNLIEVFAPMWALNAFIFEIISCSSYMVFFSKRVQLINTIISDHINNKRMDTEKSVDYEDFESSNTDLYMNEIFSGFNCLQDQYKFQVLLFCVMFFTWMVITFKYTISVLRSSIFTLVLLVDFSYMCSLAVININLLLLLGIRAEAFFDQVKETKKLSIHMLSRNIEEGCLRKKSKNMLKLIEHKPPSFSVYEMWRLNSRLVLDMINIVTGVYVIVMQFAFL